MSPTTERGHSIPDVLSQDCCEEGEQSWRSWWVGAGLGPRPRPGRGKPLGGRGGGKVPGRPAVPHGPLSRGRAASGSHRGRKAADVHAGARPLVTWDSLPVPGEDVACSDVAPGPGPTSDLSN